MFLSEDNEVFVCGDNSQGQCACKITKEHMPKPKFIKELEGVEVKDIDCKNLSLALASDGSVFVWGPLGTQDLRQPVWVQDLINMNVTKAVVGREEILIVENKSDLWNLTWNGTDLNLSRLGLSHRT